MARKGSTTLRRKTTTKATVASSATGATGEGSAPATTQPSEAVGRDDARTTNPLARMLEMSKPQPGPSSCVVGRSKRSLRILSRVDEPNGAGRRSAAAAVAPASRRESGLSFQSAANSGLAKTVPSVRALYLRRGVVARGGGRRRG